MGKKKGGKKGKKKGGDDGKAKIVVETTKEMELERASIKANALPVGSRYSTIRRADQIRAEVRIGRPAYLTVSARKSRPHPSTPRAAAAAAARWLRRG